MIDIDLSELNAVVRQALADPSLEVLKWEVQTLSTRGTGDAGGLLRVSGQASTSGAFKPWAVALKIVTQPEQGEDPTLLGYWRREGNAYTSGLLDSLPGPVIPARCYGVSAKPAAMWIWMELLVDSVEGPWDLPHYVFAADQLGRFNGACAVDAMRPDAPWLARRHARCWNELMSFDQAWRNERVRQVLPKPMQTRLLQLWAERERFFALLDQLPQAFSHFDYKRSNLFLCPRVDAQQAIVAVDWGDCGIGPLGGDLALLVGGSSFFFDWEPAHVRQLSAAALDAYLAALEAAGWRGNPAHARLAYLAWTALYFGPPVAAAIEWSLQDENRDDVLRIMGRTPGATLEPWLALCDFALDCADEVLELQERIGL